MGNYLCSQSDMSGRIRSGGRLGLRRGVLAGNVDAKLSCSTLVREGCASASVVLKKDAKHVEPTTSSNFRFTEAEFENEARARQKREMQQYHNQLLE